MTIATLKSAMMESVAQIYKKRKTVRETRTALLESIALPMIRFAMILSLREDPAQRILNVDGSPVVFRTQIALSKHANIGDLFRMALKLEKQRSKILTSSVKAYILNSTRMIRKHTVCQLQNLIKM